MNAILHFPHSLEMQPASFLDGEAPSELFNLKIIYKRGGCPQSVLHVHVPRSLQSALVDKKILCFHMQEIVRNSRAQRVLENSADYAVIAVRLRNKVEISELPPAWCRSQRQVRALGVLSAAMAALGLLANFGVVVNFAASCVLAYGLQCLKSVKAMRVRPFQCDEAYGDLSFIASNRLESSLESKIAEHVERIAVVQNCHSLDWESSV